MDCGEFVKVNAAFPGDPADLGRGQPGDAHAAGPGPLRAASRGYQRRDQVVGARRADDTAALPVASSAGVPWPASRPALTMTT